MDLDLVNDRIVLSRTKNGESRIVYLNKAAQTAGRSLQFDADTKPPDRLFQGVTDGQVSAAFRRACRAVNFFAFRFHDLRHTAASWLRMAGAYLQTVAQLLGHKDLRMAARYQHLSPAFLADAVGRLDGVFGALRYQDVTAQCGDSDCNLLIVFGVPKHSYFEPDYFLAEGNGNSASRRRLIL